VSALIDGIAWAVCSSVWLSTVCFLIASSGLSLSAASPVWGDLLIVFVIPTLVLEGFMSRRHRFWLVCILVTSVLLSAVVVKHMITPVLSQQAWNALMAQVPAPHKGCFQADYPRFAWRQVRCTTPPSYPASPRTPPLPPGPRPLIVGNGTDISAQAPTGLISQAVGSFQTVTDVTSESGPFSIGGPSVANTYSLQLNTNPFPDTKLACAGSPNPSCKGWEQFLFDNNGSSSGIYIQYWRIGYNTTCPTGWHTYSSGGDTDCYTNSAGFTPVPAQPITNLGQLSLQGQVSASGDSALMVIGGSPPYMVTGDHLVAAETGWQQAEFNIFGIYSGVQATFNSGATIVPKTQIVYGGSAAPVCSAHGFTGETNNLSFDAKAPPTVAAPGPALAFTESSAGGAPSACASSKGIGDTHLHTFNGTLYDFQATGDFVLAQTTGFTVQTRQVSGAPTWPNAAVNQAVATQMGSTRVTLCPSVQAPLVVDGTPTGLGDGGTIVLPSGVQISRTGNVYVVIDQNGNSLRAAMNPTWVDASVGLGSWPTPVSGLLANPNGNAHQLAMSNGTVLSTPLSFTDLYQRYGESWRVAPANSLLTECGSEPEHSNPTQTFFVRDLAPTIAANAQAICTQAGVQIPVWLNACILDVVVLGTPQVAAGYVGEPAPVAIGEVDQ
jgi:hypothetical protein